MEIVRTKDTGTLQYDTYFNDDQSECIVPGSEVSVLFTPYLSM
jgi:hypothetical protein